MAKLVNVYENAKTVGDVMTAYAEMRQGKAYKPTQEQIDMFIDNYNRIATETGFEPKYTAEEMGGIITELASLKGCDAKVIGCWVWVTGDTKPYKEDFKAMGAIWNNSRKCWQFSNTVTFNHYKKLLSEEEVAARYGKKEINKRTRGK